MKTKILIPAIFLLFAGAVKAQPFFNGQDPFEKSNSENTANASGTTSSSVKPEAKIVLIYESKPARQFEDSIHYIQKWPAKYKGGAIEFILVDMSFTGDTCSALFMETAGYPDEPDAKVFMGIALPFKDRANYVITTNGLSWDEKRIIFYLPVYNRQTGEKNIAVYNFPENKWVVE